MNTPTLARPALCAAPVLAAPEGPRFSSDNPLVGFVAFLAEHTRVGERSARLYVGHLQPRSGSIEVVCSRGARQLNELKRTF